MEQASFLALPLELRYEIYSHLFLNPQVNIQIYKHYNHVCCTLPGDVDPLPLLLTCKTIAEEVQHTLYGNAIFDVQAHLHHLPIVSSQSLDSRRHPVEDSTPALNVSPALSKFLRRASNVNLSLWIGALGQREALESGFEVLSRALGCAGDKTRPFRDLMVKILERPRWMMADGGRATKGDADGLVEAVMEMGQCSRRLQVDVEGRARELVNEEVWGRLEERIGKTSC